MTLLLYEALSKQHITDPKMPGSLLLFLDLWFPVYYSFDIRTKAQ